MRAHTPLAAASLFILISLSTHSGSPGYPVERRLPIHPLICSHVLCRRRRRWCRACSASRLTRASRCLQPAAEAAAAGAAGAARHVAGRDPGPPLADHAGPPTHGIHTVPAVCLKTLPPSTLSLPLRGQRVQEPSAPPLRHGCGNLKAPASTTLQSTSRVLIYRASVQSVCG